MAARVCAAPAILVLCFAPVFSALSQPLDKGHRLLIERGLQLQAMAIDNWGLSPPVWSVFDEAGFTTVNWSWNYWGVNYMSSSPNRQWAYCNNSDASHTNFTSVELPYATNCVSIQFEDEQDLNNPATRQAVAAWFAAARPHFTNTILHVNQLAFAASDSAYRDFMLTSQPDMLMFDSYRWTPADDQGVWHLLSDMQRQRKFALSGHDGTGLRPIPYGIYPQGVDYGRIPSESELRFNHFAAWTLGYKLTDLFMYNSPADLGQSILFEGGTNQSQPAPSYFQIKEINRQAKNLGPALVRLLSTDVRFIAGQHKDPATGQPVTNPNPIDFPGWSAGAGNDPCLQSVSVTNGGVKNDGLAGDVVLGWFRALDEAFDDDWAGEIYFMVCNSLTATNGSAADARQSVRLTFNFGSSGIDTVQRLSRGTGLKENILLPALPGGARQLTVDLDGGTADLFKFKTGAPFLGIADAGPPDIMPQPGSRTNSLGTDASFSARASGTAPLLYQWRFNGIDIPGATTTTCTRTNVGWADAGIYAVVVSNSSGTSTSLPATLTVIPTPPLFYEPFDYSNIGGQVTSNTPSNWTKVGTTGTDDTLVVGGSLAYPGFARPAGNSITNGGDGFAIRRLLGTTLNSGPVYFSVLFNLVSFGGWGGGAVTAGAQVAALTSTNNTSFRLQIMVKSNTPSTYLVGVQKGGTGASSAFSPTACGLGTPVLLVGKYDFSTTPNPVTLWVNPAPATFGSAEPAVGSVTTSTGTDDLAIDRFNFRQNVLSGSSSVPGVLHWDELRVGTNWATVTPMRTPLRFNTVRASGTGLQLYGSGDPGTFAIEASTNLVSWTEITNFTSASGVFEFGTSTTNLARCFYRLHIP